MTVEDAVLEKVKKLPVEKKMGLRLNIPESNMLGLKSNGRISNERGTPVTLGNLTM